MTAEPQAVKRKQRVGTVVSHHGEKTIVVLVERASRHRLYRKVIRRTKRYHVHDESNAATSGDLVRIEESRPMSATKRWRLIEVLTERAIAEVAPESIDETLVSDVQRTAARAEAEAAETGEGAAEAASPVAADAETPDAPEPAEADEATEAAEPAETTEAPEVESAEASTEPGEESAGEESAGDDAEEETPGNA
jgi:small subunit ribosomal protein S17